AARGRRRRGRWFGGNGGVLFRVEVPWGDLRQRVGPGRLVQRRRKVKAGAQPSAPCAFANCFATLRISRRARPPPCPSPCAAGAAASRQAPLRGTPVRSLQA